MPPTVSINAFATREPPRFDSVEAERTHVAPGQTLEPLVALREQANRTQETARRSHVGV